MRVFRLWRHGVTVATVPEVLMAQPPIRTACVGWSEAATRRNVAFLRSVDERRLSAEGARGYAVTLTLRDCPPSPEAWHRLRRAYVERLRRAGLVRLHWVTEWQRRGVPHLHGAAWLPQEAAGVLLTAWLAVAAPYGAGASGQHVRAIDNAVGWFQYVAKHMARGVAHYQRSRDGIPEAWQSRTGRVWGRIGTWPTVPPADIYPSDAEFYRIRRLIRSWRVAAARCLPEAQRVRSIVRARRMLKCSDPKASAVRGLSEWLPEHQLLQLYALAIALCDPR